MKIKTSELTGAALDWAVGMAEGLDYPADSEEFGCYEPSSDWSQGGPLIDKHDVQILKFHGETMAGIGEGLVDYYPGSTRLIAACRAIVASKLGDEVDVPEELL